LSYSAVSDGVIVYVWEAVQYDNKYTYGYMIWRRYLLGQRFPMMISNKKWSHLAPNRSLPFEN